MRHNRALIAAPISALLAATAASAQPCQPQFAGTFRPMSVDASATGHTSINSLVPFDPDGSGPLASRVFASGRFASIGGTTANGLAMWDGRRWQATAPGPSSNAWLAVLDDDGPGPHLPALYALGDTDLYRWDSGNWTVIPSAELLWATTEPLTFRDPYRIFAIHDGPGDAQHLYLSTSESADNSAGPASVFDWSGKLYRLESNGTWTDTQVYGSVSAMAALPVQGQSPIVFAVAEAGSEVDIDNWFHEFDDGSALVLLSPSGPQTVLLSEVMNEPPRPFTSLAPYADAAGPQVLYIGANYRPDPSAPTQYLLRYDGSVPTPIDADGPVSVATVEPDPLNAGRASLYATGSFSHIAGSAAPGLARWNGSAWSTVTAAGFNGPVSTFTVFDNDGPGPKPPTLFAAGSFTQAGYAPSIDIAEFDAPYWLSPGNVLDNAVHAVLAADLGDGPALYAAGSFAHAGGFLTPGLARWNGSSWSPLGPGFNNHVDALALYNDNGTPRLIAAGKFTGAGSAALNHIAIWRNSTCQPLAGGLNGDVACLLASGATLYAGGAFTAAAGAPTARRLAAWNGSSWSALGQFDDNVNALAIFQGSVYAAGRFTQITSPDNSQGIYGRIARLSGSRWLSPVYGVNAEVLALAVHDDGSGPALYAGGAMGAAGNVPVSRIARWNGSVWSDVGGGFGGNNPAATVITSLAPIDEGGRTALYAGGNFTQAGPAPAGNLARWDGQSWAAVGAGLDNTVRALAALDPGGPLPHPRQLFAGGDFLASDNTPSWFLASWQLCDPSACYANCDGSAAPPILNVNDFLCFQTRFAAGDPYANCDGSTTPPILNVNDFLCFQARFAQGCP